MIQDTKMENEVNNHSEPSSYPSSPSPKDRKKKRIKPTGINWLDEPYCMVKGETALWIAVITQAMMDALSRSGNPEMRYLKDQAIRWLTGNSKDFIEVCLNAGLNPDYVRRKAKKSLLSPVEWRAAPGKGKRYMESKQKRAKHDSQKSSAAIEPEHPASNCLVIAGPWNTFTQ